MKSLIEILVKALVDQPDQVEIKEISSPDSVTYEIKVANDDMGKVIGKGGKIANALRIVAKAAAMKEKIRVYVEIVE
ncbi:MAG: KH domain-containing protein [Armatimonadota bacterium]|nr:KH domain-containing protein [Armatimonadota bacterium]